MSTETVYADLVLAVAALIAGVLYLRVRRRHVKRKKSGPPVRPATPSPQSAAAPGRAVTTWAPPPLATPAAPIAPTAVVQPSPSWDQSPARSTSPAWQAGAQSPSWGAPGAGPQALHRCSHLPLRPPLRPPLLLGPRQRGVLPHRGRPSRPLLPLPRHWAPRHLRRRPRPRRLLRGAARPPRRRHPPGDPPRLLPHPQRHHLLRHGSRPSRRARRPRRRP